MYYLFVAGEASKDASPQPQPCQGVPAILSRACVDQNLARHVHQSEFAVGQQAGVGGRDRAAKSQPQAAVEIKPDNTVIRFRPTDSPPPACRG